MRGVAIASLVLALAGCAGTGLGPLDRPAATPPGAIVQDVPFVAQAEGHCGPAALAMALGWSGDHVAAAALAPSLITPARGGTFEHDLAGLARWHGRLTVPIEGIGEVLDEVAAGHPVIVLQNLALSWWPQWHYAVVIGYDLEADRILLHSGTEEARWVGLPTFRQTFERAGERAMVILPPARLPALGDEARLVEAAAGLERAGGNRAALEAYDAILGRWPDNATARLGRGNVFLAEGELDRAEATYRKVLDRDEANVPAWNNLAHLLMLRGSFAEARTAGRRALALGGPGERTVRQTLLEIDEAERRPG